jgi:hypothetical protein
MKEPLTLDQQARALGVTLISIWANWNDRNEDDADNALRLAFEAVLALDLTRVAGQMASPLKYFAHAYLEDCNPEDLTFDEMFQSIEISLSL